MENLRISKGIQQPYHELASKPQAPNRITHGFRAKITEETGHKALERLISTSSNVYFQGIQPDNKHTTPARKPLHLELVHSLITSSEYTHEKTPKCIRD
jgi:hypothetical protein